MSDQDDGGGWIIPILFAGFVGVGFFWFSGSGLQGNGCTVTDETYHAIRNGMTVADVEAIVGCPGVEQIRAGSGMFENLFMIYDSGSAALVIGYLGGGVISKARM